MKHAVYSGTRNLYEAMVWSAKSLVANSSVDRVHFLIEDDAFPFEMPDFCDFMNVREYAEQTFPDGRPNSRSHFTRMAMVRICYPLLLAGIDMVLQLDADTVVVDNVDALWDIDLDGKWFVATHEALSGYDPFNSGHYQNVGVCLFNLAQMREDRAQAQLVEFINTRFANCIEQDALNVVGTMNGDILLRDPWGSGGHTEMYIGSNQLVGAHSAEDGGVYGQPGDQTGNEISVGPMWGSWDYVLRPSKDGGYMGEWIEKNGKWWYRHSDGSWTSNGWEYIGGKWYFFDADGWMKTGWIKWGVNWFYLQPKTAKTGDSYGHMVTGWQTIKWRNKNCKFYFSDNGDMFPGGFYKVDGKWYAFDSNGVVVQDDAKVVVAKDGAVTIEPAA